MTISDDGWGGDGWDGLPEHDTGDDGISQAPAETGSLSEELGAAVAGSGSPASPGGGATASAAAVEPDSSGWDVPASEVERVELAAGGAAAIGAAAGAVAGRAAGGGGRAPGGGDGAPPAAHPSPRRRLPLVPVGAAAVVVVGAVVAVVIATSGHNKPSADRTTGHTTNGGTHSSVPKTSTPLVHGASTTVAPASTASTGATGTSGSSGATAPKLPSGITGTTGTSGSTGTAGSTGTTGTSGSTGTTGTSGSTGTTGTSGSTGTTGTSGSTGTTGTSGTSGSTSTNEPPLLSVVPTGLDGRCEQAPESDYISKSVVDDVSCDALSINGFGAEVVGYSRFTSASAIASYYASVLAANGLSAAEGDCSTGDLSGTVSGGQYCEGVYTDSDGNTGHEMLYVGTGITIGGSDGSTAAFCDSVGQGSTGVSILLWTSPSDRSVGAALDCTDSTTGYAEAMEEDLQSGAYVLND